MRKKRFVKLCMSKGISRNDADFFAFLVKYTHNHIDYCWMMDYIERLVQVGLKSKMIKIGGERR